MLSVVMLNAIILCAIMWSVVARKKWLLPPNIFNNRYRPK
jgi:hypothetical protein